MNQYFIESPPTSQRVTINPLTIAKRKSIYQIVIQFFRSKLVIDHEVECLQLQFALFIFERMISASVKCLQHGMLPHTIITGKVGKQQPTIRDSQVLGHSHRNVDIRNVFVFANIRFGQSVRQFCHFIIILIRFVFNTSLSIHYADEKAFRLEMLF